MNRGERYRTMPYLDANGLLAWGFEKKGQHIVKPLDIFKLSLLFQPSKDGLSSGGFVF